MKNTVCYGVTSQLGDTVLLVADFYICSGMSICHYTLLVVKSVTVVPISQIIIT